MGEHTGVDEVGDPEQPLVERHEVQLREPPTSKSEHLLLALHHPRPVQRVDVRERRERPGYGVQPEGVHDVVVVEVGHDISGGGGQAEVPRRGHPAPAGSHDPDALVRQGRQHGRCLVLASVIHHDQLPALMALAEDRADRRAHAVGPVARGHDD